MKKALVILTASLLASSLIAVPATTFAATKYNKKHHKKIKLKKRCCRWVPKKTEPVADAKEEKKDAKQRFLDQVSGTFDFTSNYMFRGISQTGNKPAVQGGLTYTFPIGFYLNLWGSNVDFIGVDGRRATSEFDTIIGYHKALCNDFFIFDINLDRYNYIGAEASSYNELNTLWIFSIYKCLNAALQFGWSYTGNYSGTHGAGQYTNVTLTFDIPNCYMDNLTLALEAGHYSLARRAGWSYNDYSALLNKKISDTYTVGVQWVGTNGRANLPPLDDSTFLGTVTAYF